MEVESNMDNYLQTGNFPCKSEWKRVVVGSLKKVENEKWGKKIHCYDQLRLYKHVIKELAPNMWLRMGLDNTKMADNVSLIVKVLSGSKKGKRKIYIIKANASFLNYFTKS